MMQGRCHMERSGFEGPWTANPLIFDNSYFKYDLCSSYTSNFCIYLSRHILFLHLFHFHIWNLNRELLSGEKEGLLQLPSDKALLSDPVFRPYVEKYAAVRASASLPIIFDIVMSKILISVLTYVSIFIRMRMLSSLIMQRLT